MIDEFTTKISRVGIDHETHQTHEKRQQISLTASSETINHCFIEGKVPSDTNRSDFPFASFKLHDSIPPLCTNQAHALTFDPLE